MSAFGDLVDEYEIGAVRVYVRYGCVRRDQYELRAAPLPPQLRDELARTGTVRGSEVLYVVDVEGVHQITVAPAQGRVLVMPRLSRGREEQRRAADGVAALVDASLRHAPASK